ncbi:hypothetical protein [Polaromonas glacialis]|uniref:hypothetical protein n=1 Tax=Polaromonas glacialis TaxID=866564 RepID=UPI0012EB3B03|nr:hypothetical protein [Polaromonas glacialis]
MSELNVTHAAKETRDGRDYLSRLTRQLRFSYGRYLKLQPKQLPEPHVQFILGMAAPDGYWIGTCESPKFKLVATDETGAAIAIGDSPRGQISAAASMRHALSAGFPSDQTPMLAATFIDGGMALLYPQRYVEGAEEEHGVSSLFCLFRLDRELGLRPLPYKQAVFKGRISDRNLPLGYAPTNEVVFDDKASTFVLVDCQSGQRNVLVDFLTFDAQRLGTVNTRFDPYQLTG